MMIFRSLSLSTSNMFVFIAITYLSNSTSALPQVSGNLQPQDQSDDARPSSSGPSSSSGAPPSQQQGGSMVQEAVQAIQSGNSWPDDQGPGTRAVNKRILNEFSTTFSPQQDNNQNPHQAIPKDVIVNLLDQAKRWVATHRYILDISDPGQFFPHPLPFDYTPVLTDQSYSTTCHPSSILETDPLTDPSLLAAVRQIRVRFNAADKRAERYILEQGMRFDPFDSWLELHIVSASSPPPQAIREPSPRSPRLYPLPLLAKNAGFKQSTHTIPTTQFDLRPDDKIQLFGCTRGMAQRITVRSASIDLIARDDLVADPATGEVPVSPLLAVKRVPIMGDGVLVTRVLEGERTGTYRQVGVGDVVPVPSGVVQFVVAGPQARV